MPDNGPSVHEPQTGEDWVAVTDVARVVNPGQGVLRWANRLGLDGKRLDDHERGAWGGGRILHRVYERRVKGQLDAGGVERERLVVGGVVGQYIRGLERWWEDTAPRVTHCEHALQSSRLMVRGRTDGIRACTDPACYCHGEGSRAFDFKTGGHRLYGDAHRQGAGYVVLIDEEPLLGVHLCGVELVTLDGRGTYRVQACQATREDFLAALAIYRLDQRLRARMKAFAPTLDG